MGPKTMRGSRCAYGPYITVDAGLILAVGSNEPSAEQHDRSCSHNAFTPSNKTSVRYTSLGSYAAPPKCRPASCDKGITCSMEFNNTIKFH